MQDNVAATIRNCHTVFLSGDGPNSTKIDEKFESAKHNLYDVHLVGIVDRYDESMVVFEEYLRKYFPSIDLSYVRKNVTDTVTGVSMEEKADKLLLDLDEELRHLVLEKNAYDIEIYKLASDLLDEKINRINDFDVKLQKFQQRCQELNG